MKMTRIALVIVALAFGVSARAQDEHHPAPETAKPAGPESANPKAQMPMAGMMAMEGMVKGCQEQHAAMAGMMDRMAKTIEDAKASNDVSKMRGALDQMQTQMSDMREQMKMCAGMMDMMHGMMSGQGGTAGTAK